MAFIDSELKARETPSDPIHPIRLAAQIQKAVGDDAYYVIDGGDTSYFGLVHLSSRHRAGVIAPGAALLGCMGTGGHGPYSGSAGDTSDSSQRSRRPTLTRNNSRRSAMN
jgi:hypothetical protein